MKKFIAILFVFFMVCPVFAKEIPLQAAKYYNQGIDYFNAGKYDMAITSFKNAVSIHPEFYNAYYNLAQTYKEVGNKNDTMWIYKKIISLKPDDFETVYALSEMLYNKGSYKDALTYLYMIPYFAPEYSKAQKMIDKTEEKIAAQEKTASVQKPAVQAQNTPTQTIDIPVVQTPAVKDVTYTNVGAPSGVAADKSGNLYIADFGGNVIYKITPDGTKIVFADGTNIGGPLGLATDDSGNVYAANYSKNNIVKIAPDKTVKEIMLVKMPYCIFISDGYLYVSEQSTNTVVKHKL